MERHVEPVTHNEIYGCTSTPCRWPHGEEPPGADFNPHREVTPPDKGRKAVEAARAKTPPAGTQKVSWLLGYAAALAAVEKELSDGNRTAGA